MNRLLLSTLLFAIMLTGCKKDKGSVYSDAIIGEWSEMYYDRLPAPTDNVAVIEFKADGSINMSFIVAVGESKSVINAEGKYKVDGNTLSVNSSYSYKGIKYNEVTIYEIADMDSEAATLKYISSTGGIRLEVAAEQVGWKRIPVNQLYNIEGWWLIERIDTVNVNFVVNYKKDGTYDFYKKEDSDVYVLQKDQKCNYKTAGNLLFTWWIDNGKDYADNWIIDYYAANYKMNWTARRVGSDGFDYQSSTALQSIIGLNENGEILK